MEVAKDRNTYIVIIKPQDEDGTAVTPNSMSWTLTNEYGRVVNSRDHVSIASPSTEMNVVLSANDVDHDDGRERWVIAEGKYNSSLGSSLDLRDWTKFTVDDTPTV
jgi:hypothetical protein